MHLVARNEVEAHRAVQEPLRHIDARRAAVHSKRPNTFEDRLIALLKFLLAEGNGFCSIDSHEWPAHRGSVGRTTLGELHILDDDQRELPIGKVGTIYFAGGFDFSYHNGKLYKRQLVDEYRQGL